MKKNVFHELAWFKTRETLKPMPKWWYAWKWFSILFMPMFISWLWILGLMGLLGIKFNVINIIISTFIFGLGDDLIGFKRFSNTNTTSRFIQ